MLIQNELRVLSILILFCSFTPLTSAQTCSDWLYLNTAPSYAFTNDITIPFTKLTVEAKFVRTTPFTAGSSGDLVVKYNDPNSINFVLRPTGALITTVNGVFSTPEVCAIELNKVYHVALVYDGSVLRFYRNGYLMSEVPATGNMVQQDNNTYIGHHDGTGSPNFIGYIDDVRIWDYARPQDLLRNYMNIDLPTPAAQVGLLAYYTFENLLNKQGDNTLTLSLSNDGAAINTAPADCAYIADSCEIFILPPDSIVITNNLTICAGSHHQIRSHPADTYQWTPAAYLDDPTSPTPVATPPVTTTFYVQAYIAATNKTIIDSVRINVERSDIKSINDTTVCAGSPVQMNVTQGTSFIWSPIAGLSDPLIANPVARPLTTTKYVVVGIGTGRCASADTVLITVLPGPDIVTSNDTVICRDATVQLQASGGVNYQWLPSAPLDNPGIASPLATTSQTTAYTVTAEGSNGCSKTDTINVEVRTHPNFASTGSKTVCDGEAVVLEASGGDSYEWSPAANVSSPFSSSTTVTALNRTSLFSVHISENACGYDTTMAMTVTVNPNPVVAALKSNDINCGSPTSILEASGADSYFWEPFVYLDNANAAKTFAAVDTTTTFTVTGFTNAGCTSSASVTVNVDRGGVPRFVLPNAFTPNNDGRNDCFGIKRWGTATITQFSIYNRWGQQVFQSKDPGRCWDGKVNGVLQPAGGYIYIIDAATLCGPVKRRGSLSLIR